MKKKICKKEKELKKVNHNLVKDSDSISDNREFSPKLQNLFIIINNVREMNAKDLLTMKEKIRIESLLKELEEKKDPKERSKMKNSLSIEDEILLLEIINARGILRTEMAKSKIKDKAQD